MESKQASDTLEHQPTASHGLAILVPRGHDPFSQHQESRPLASPNFWACEENYFFNFQPIRFVRFYNESVIRGLPVLGAARGLDSWCWRKGSWPPLGTRMTAWPVSNACAQPYHPGMESCFSLGDDMAVRMRALEWIPPPSNDLTCPQSSILISGKPTRVIRAWEKSSDNGPLQSQAQNINSPNVLSCISFDDIGENLLVHVHNTPFELVKRPHKTKLTSANDFQFSLVLTAACLSRPAGPGHEQQMALGTHDLIG